VVPCLLRLSTRSFLLTFKECGSHHGRELLEGLLSSRRANKTHDTAARLQWYKLHQQSACHSVWLSFCVESCSPARRSFGDPPNPLLCLNTWFPSSSPRVWHARLRLHVSSTTPRLSFTVCSGSVGACHGPQQFVSGGLSITSDQFLFAPKHPNNNLRLSQHLSHPRSSFDNRRLTSVLRSRGRSHSVDSSNGLFRVGRSQQRAPPILLLNQT
jgi:hypothetical protein